MKRLLIRMTLLSLVVGLGTVVVFEAQRRLHPPEATPGELSANLEQQPIPVTDIDSQSSGMADPNGMTGGGNSDAGFRLAANQGPSADDFQQRDYGSPQAEPAAVFTQEPVASNEPYAEAGRFPAADVAEPARLGQQMAGGDPIGVADSDTPARFATSQTETAPPDAKADDDWQDHFAPPSSASQGNYRSTPSAASSAPPAGYDPPMRGDDNPPTGRGVGRPGERQLEGAQAPSLTIEKRAPKEIQVGKAATFTTTVRNQGQVPAQGVEVRDLVPQGTELVSTTPQAEQGPQGELIWQLGTLKPGGETSVQMELMPLAEGEIGSVATLHFKADASVRTMATRPQVAIDVSAPPRVMIGTDVMLRIKISNPGSGAATGVVVTELVPPNLTHPAGGELEFEIGTLKPGEVRELELALKAAHPGPVTNMLVARGDANLQAEGQAQFEVVAPDLKVSMSGPKHRFLERSAVYTISVSNPGTAPAKEIDLVATLPKGLKFVEANNAGQYDPATGAVFWSLEQLPAGETGTVTLATLPTEAGELHLQIAGRAQGKLSDKIDETVFVEGIAAIVFDVVDVNDPIEVGGETTYEIRVTNQGSKASSNVRLVVLLAPELQAIHAEGPTGHAIDGQRVLFEPIRQLAPKADTTYSVRVKAGATGDLRLRVQLVTDEMRTPLTKEESTHVYADE